MPPKKSKIPAKPGNGKQGGGSNVQTRATRPPNAPNWQRTLATSAPAPSPIYPASVARAGNPLRPLQRPIIFVPGVHTRVLFSCDHEDEAKQVESDVKEEVVHVDNVDALDRGAKFGMNEGQKKEEDIATHALTIGSLVLAFKDVHLRSDRSGGTSSESETSSTSEEEETNGVLIAAEMHAEQRIAVAPVIQGALPAQKDSEKTLRGVLPTLSNIGLAGTTTHNHDAAYMYTILQTLRKSVQNPGSGGKRKVSLPKASNKEVHKYVYELAGAFHMSGAKKKKNSGDQIVLVGSKKAKPKQVDEKRVAMVMKKFGLPTTVPQGNEFKSKPHGVPVGKAAPNQHKGQSGKVRPSGHKEGDTIGKEAPKINASNMGFRMLETMGWSEGEKIGSSASGLEAPIDAVIKRSRLGLGACTK